MTTETQTKNWYTIKVQTNRERSVSERIKQDMMREFEEEVNFFIPTESNLSLKNGKKVIREKLLFPGYIFVETTSVDKVIYLVKTTNGAASVLKNSNGSPQVLKQSEIDRMMGQKKESRAVVEALFINGEEVEIINGPFAKFKGKIDSMEMEKNKVRVEVLIFGRPTSVDLTFDDIVKIKND